MGGGQVEPIPSRWTEAWTLQLSGDGGQSKKVAESGWSLADASSLAPNTDLQSYMGKGLGQADSPCSTVRETEGQGG